MAFSPVSPATLSADGRGYLSIPTDPTFLSMPERSASPNAYAVDDNQTRLTEETLDLKKDDIAAGDDSNSHTHSSALEMDVDLERPATDTLSVMQRQQNFTMSSSMSHDPSYFYPHLAHIHKKKSVKHIPFHKNGNMFGRPKSYTLLSNTSSISIYDGSVSTTTLDDDDDDDDNDGGDGRNIPYQSLPQHTKKRQKRIESVELPGDRKRRMQMLVACFGVVIMVICYHSSAMVAYSLTNRYSQPLFINYIIHCFYICGILFAKLFWSIAEYTHDSTIPIVYTMDQYYNQITDFPIDAGVATATTNATNATTTSTVPQSDNKQLSPRGGKPNFDNRATAAATSSLPHYRNDISSHPPKRLSAVTPRNTNAPTIDSKAAHIRSQSAGVTTPIFGNTRMFSPILSTRSTPTAAAANVPIFFSYGLPQRRILKFGRILVKSVLYIAILEFVYFVLLLYSSAHIKDTFIYTSIIQMLTYISAYLFSIYILNHTYIRDNRRKNAAIVIVALGILCFFANNVVNVSQWQSKPNSTFFSGLLSCILASLCRGLQLTLIFVVTHGYFYFDNVWLFCGDTFFVIGLYGAIIAIVTWPFLFVADTVGWETFEPPNQSIIWIEIIEMCILEMVYNICLIGGIALVNAVFMALAELSVLPSIFIVAKVLRILAINGRYAYWHFWDNNDSNVSSGGATDIDTESSSLQSSNVSPARHFMNLIVGAPMDFSGAPHSFQWSGLIFFALIFVTVGIVLYQLRCRTITNHFSFF